MIVNCLECGKEISDTANSCPHCGAPKDKATKIPTGSKVGGVIMMVVAGIAFMLVPGVLTGMIAFALIILGALLTKGKSI